MQTSLAVMLGQYALDIRSQRLEQYCLRYQKTLFEEHPAYGEPSGWALSMNDGYNSPHGSNTMGLEAEHRYHIAITA